MGIFGKGKSNFGGDVLPAVANSDYLDIKLPQMGVMYMPDFEWMLKLQSKGVDRFHWIGVIAELDKAQLNTMEDSLVEGYRAVVFDVLALEELPQDQQILDSIYPFARFGVLAGMLDNICNVTPKGKCHPIVWLSLNVLFMETVKEEKEETGYKFPDHQLGIKEATALAGYALARGLDHEFVYSRWRR
jgi:hypothetical protein